MRGRVFMFLTLVFLLLLMMSALVVCSGEELPVFTGHEAQMCAQIEPFAPQPLSPQHRDRARRVLPAPLKRLPALKGMDLNGVPILRCTFVRANYIAFHYSDSAG